jgi:predicted RNase H-like nuclease (RuvC/YqgF family)
MSDIDPNDLDKRILGNTLAGPFFESAEGKEWLASTKKAYENRAKVAVEVMLLEKDAENARLRERIDKLEPEVERMTAELRTINRNASEDRITRLVTERVTAATLVLQNELATARHAVTTLTAKCDELTASKKKLREALDRAKGK